MKRIIVLTVAFVFSAVATVFAAGDEKNGHAYFAKAELPDMTKILPPFPPFESARQPPMPPRASSSRTARRW